MTLESLQRARDAYQRQAWAEAYKRFSALAAEGPLELADRDRFAIVAYLTTHIDEADEHRALGYREALEQGEPGWAARFAFWSGFQFLFRGEPARGGAWLSRAREVMDAHDLDGAERGYVMVPGGLGQLESGDIEGAIATFEEVYRIGVQFADRDLTTFGCLGRGQSLARAGRVSEGVALLDEAMVAVTASEVSPIISGIAYCVVIETCHEMFDLTRAQEWTRALAGWCERHPDRAPFQGHCLVRRAELLQLRGAWSEAITEAARALERLAGDPTLGLGWYVQADLQRLRGEFEGAEDGYRQASRWGYQPQPGLALLRLAQGQVESAARAIRAAVEETSAVLPRCHVLSAYIEIMIVHGDLPAAREAADQLASCAIEVGAPLLGAIAAHATGAVRLAEGDARGAIVPLQDAWTRWQAIDAPYDAARTRMLIGRARLACGDTEGAALDLDAARSTFAELGAAPALAELKLLEVPPASPNGMPPGGLTARELEVLRLVATGTTNRGIAAELVISEKTVARHLSNIFTKLDLTSRAAATAWAYEHHLL